MTHDTEWMGHVTWHMICDTWYVIHDMLYMMNDKWYMMHLSDPKPGHTTGESSNGGERRGGEAGRSRAGWDADGSIRPGDKYLPGHRTNLLWTTLQKHEQAKFYVNRRRNKTREWPPVGDAPEGFQGGRWNQTSNPCKEEGGDETWNPKGFQVWFKRKLKHPLNVPSNQIWNPFGFQTGKFKANPQPFRVSNGGV